MTTNFSLNNEGLYKRYTQSTTNNLDEVFIDTDNESISFSGKNFHCQSFVLATYCQKPIHPSLVAQVLYNLINNNLGSGRLLFPCIFPLTSKDVTVPVPDTNSGTTQFSQARLHTYEVVVNASDSTISEFVKMFNQFTVSFGSHILGSFAFIKEYIFLETLCDSTQSRQIVSKFILDVLKNEVNKIYASNSRPNLKPLHRHLAVRVYNSEAGRVLPAKDYIHSSYYNDINQLFTEVLEHCERIAAHHSSLLGQLDGLSFVQALAHPTPPNRQTQRQITDSEMNASNRSP